MHIFYHLVCRVQITHHPPPSRPISPFPQIWNENPDPQQKLCVVVVQVSSKTQVFWGQKNSNPKYSGSKKNFDQTVLGPKKIPTQILLGKKRFRILNFWVQKNFWSKFLGLKKFSFKKNVCVKKNFDPHFFESTKFFWPTFFLVRQISDPNILF